MASPVLTASSTLLCPHGGRATVAISNPRVLVGGVPVVTVVNPAVVAGCPNVANPCTMVKWPLGADRVLISGFPVVRQENSGLVLTEVQELAGAAVIAVTQSRAVAG